MPLTRRPLLSALFCVLALGAAPAQAAASSRATGTLQVLVEVVRACAIDTSSAQSSGPFDTTQREALVHATASSLSASCGVSEVRVAVSDVPVISVGQSGTVPRLEIQF